jgi:hypothetical protein
MQLLLLLAISQAKKDPRSIKHGSFARSRDLGRHRERIGHFECFNIVRVIERENRANKSSAEIASGLSRYCEHLDHYRKEICEALVPRHIESALKMIKDQRRPDFVCELLGYSRFFGASRVIARDVCIQIIDDIRDSGDRENMKRPAVRRSDDGERPMAREATRRREGDQVGKEDSETTSRHRKTMLHGDEAPPALARTRALHGPGVCNRLDGEAKVACVAVWRVVSRGMRDELQSGATSDEICERLSERNLIKFRGQGTINAPE